MWSGADGQFFIAIDIAAFTDVEGFKHRVDAISSQFYGSKRAPGSGSIFMPGAMEAEIAERNAKFGIPLNAETLLGIAASAKSLGVRIRL